MRREEKASADRQAIPAILKKARVDRLSMRERNAPIPAVHGS